MWLETEHDSLNGVRARSLRIRPGALGSGGPGLAFERFPAEALGFGGPGSALAFAGREALGFGGPGSALAFAGLRRLGLVVQVQR